uniref:Uncharacterized protein n=1 Tax=Noctiluca scintillans TaxID=2966 RepID=A0A7S1F7H5_NOCSC|mmetsp:Transcript_40685/g.107782  ORF Transcript_40685/g.107782 Transcript_40685/m.107782 type:complete len:590 (+) Transcript_40685:55-1824(+)
MRQFVAENTWANTVFPGIQQLISNATGGVATNPTPHVDQSEHGAQTIDSFRVHRPDAELLRKAEKYRQQFFTGSDLHEVPSPVVLLPFLCKPTGTEQESVGTRLDKRLQAKPKAPAKDLKELCQQASLSRDSDGMFGRGLLELSLEEVPPDTERLWKDPPSEQRDESEGGNPRYARPEHQELQHEESREAPPTSTQRRTEVQFAERTGGDGSQQVGKEGTVPQHSDGTFGRTALKLNLDEVSPNATTFRTDLPFESESQLDEPEEDEPQHARPEHQKSQHDESREAPPTASERRPTVQFAGEKDPQVLRSSTMDKARLDGMAREFGFSVLKDVDLTDNFFSNSDSDDTPRSEDDTFSKTYSQKSSSPSLGKTVPYVNHSTASSSHSNSRSIRSKINVGLTKHEDSDDDQRENDEGEKVAGALYTCRESHPHLFEALMVIPVPCTPEVMYLQMCVRYNETEQWYLGRQRNQALQAMDPDEHWRLEQLVGFLTSHPQKIKTLTRMLDIEARKRQELSSRKEEGGEKFWLFIEQFKYMNFLVRHRNFFTPPRRPRVGPMQRSQSTFETDVLFKPRPSMKGLFKARSSMNGLS